MTPHDVDQHEVSQNALSRLTPSVHAPKVLVEGRGGGEHPSIVVTPEVSQGAPMSSLKDDAAVLQLLVGRSILNTHKTNTTCPSPPMSPTSRCDRTSSRQHSRPRATPRRPF